jgi:hypothetical protein
MSEYRHKCLQKLVHQLLLSIFFLAICQLTMAQAWQPLGPNDDNWPTLNSGISSPYDSVYATTMVLDKAGNPCIVYIDKANDYKVRVRKYNGEMWVDVGLSGVSSTWSDYASLAIDSNDILYVAYSDGDLNGRITVKKFDGINWVDVGVPGFSGVYSTRISIVIDKNNFVYVGYKQLGPSCVKKYNGNAWIDILPQDFFISEGEPSLKIDNNGVLYMICSTWNPIGIMIKKYNGITWINNWINLSTYINASFSLAFNRSNTPYLAYKDPANGNKVAVKMYDGSNWIDLGSPWPFAASIQLNSLLIDNNDIPYIACGGTASNPKVAVKKYQGTNWVDVGAPYFSVNERALSVSMAVDKSNTLYATYISGGDYRTSSEKVAVKKYDGNSWVDIGTTGFFAGEKYGLTLDVGKKGIPYVAYFDEFNGNKGIVKKYDRSDWINLGVFSDGKILETSIKSDESGIPYVLYADSTNSYKARVKKYNGTTWADVGVGGFSTGAIRFPSMVIDNSNVPYITFFDAGISKLRVMKFNGITWIDVGTNPSIVTGAINTSSLSLDNNGVLYIAYGVTGGAGVKKFDGTNWVSVGSLIFDQFVDFISIVVDGTGVPYLAYKASSQVRIKKFTGGSWINVSGVGLTSDYITNVDLAIDHDGALYITYSAGDTFFEPQVKKFDGTSWASVGARVAPGPGKFTAVAITPTGVPIVVYNSLYVYAKAFCKPPALGEMKANKTAEQTGKLTWTTDDERDILYFEVQYSTNNQDFQNIGRVNARSGMGGIVGSANYQFIHTNPVKGINYYRVKAVNAYGCGKLSNIAEVGFDISFIALVFPNRLTDQSVLSVTTDKESMLNIRVIDISGKLLWRRYVFLNQGSNRFNLPVANWSHGIYLLEVSLPSGERRTIRLLK